MSLFIRDTHGFIALGDYSISWGNALSDVGLPGFCVIGLGSLSLEFGDVDQGKPGIYTSIYSDGEIVERKVLWQAA